MYKKKSCPWLVIVIYFSTEEGSVQLLFHFMCASTKYNVQGGSNMTGMICV
jgi:hypothetical protein